MAHEPVKKTEKLTGTLLRKEEIPRTSYELETERLTTNRQKMADLSMKRKRLFPQHQGALFKETPSLCPLNVPVPHMLD